MATRWTHVRWGGIGLVAAAVASGVACGVDHRKLRADLSNSYTLEAEGSRNLEHLYLFRDGTYRTMLDKSVVLDDYGWSQEGTWTLEGSTVTLHPVTVDKTIPQEIEQSWNSEHKHPDAKDRIRKLFADRKLSIARSKPPYWLKFETTAYEELLVKDLIAKSDLIFRPYRK